MRTKSIGLSVIIPTHDRLWLLERTLITLIKQLSAIDELIVVDNNIGESSRNLVSSLKRQNKNISIKYFVEKQNGPSYARNLGIKQSKNPIIAFLDDDCFVNSRWISNIKDYYSNSQNNNTVIQGKIIHRFNNKGIQEQLLVLKNNYIIERTGVNNCATINYINAGNFACSRKLINKYEHFFNEEEFPFIAEEKELANRLNFAGTKIIILNTIAVLHNKRSKSILQMFKTSILYGYYFGKIEAKFEGSKKITNLFFSEIKKHYKRNFFEELQFIVKNLNTTNTMKFFILVFLLLKEVFYQIAFLFGYHIKKRFNQ